MIGVFGTIEPPLYGNYRDKEGESEVDKAESEQYGFDLLGVGLGDIVKVSEEGEVVIKVGGELD